MKACRVGQHRTLRSVLALAVCLAALGLSKDSAIADVAERVMPAAVSVASARQAKEQALEL
ncbi:MAG TPA: hypothetical protein VNW92_18855 [Polyangiaceae bacterium]|jgi:hypothetical protein|nr:hypothetical protein [Polyangiaceae bacterium]